MYLEGIWIFIALIDSFTYEMHIKSDYGKDWLNYDQIIDEIISVVNKTKS